MRFTVHVNGRVVYQWLWVAVDGVRWVQSWVVVEDEDGQDLTLFGSASSCSTP